MSEQRRRRPVPLTAVYDPQDTSRAASPSALLEAAGDEDLVRWALGKLPQLQRSVLVLRFLRGLPYAEVASALGRSEEAVRALQYRGLSRMRELLRSSGADR